MPIHIRCLLLAESWCKISLEIPRKIPLELKKSFKQLTFWKFSHSKQRNYTTCLEKFRFFFEEAILWTFIKIKVPLERRGLHVGYVHITILRVATPKTFGLDYRKEKNV